MPAKQAMGEGWTNAVHRDDRERVFAEWNHSVGKNCNMKLEHRICRPDGQVLWVLVQTTRLLTPSGEITGYIGTITDITELRQREKLEAELQQEKVHIKTVEKEKEHLHEKEMLIKDLHDGIGGIITNITMLGQYGLLQPDIEQCRQILHKIVGLASEGGAEIRSFMNSIESSESSWTDLLAEIKGFMSKMFEPQGIFFEVSSDIPEAMQALGVYRYVNIVRICREIVTNIVKHAGADTVTFVFQVSLDRLALSIADNGIGFDPSAVKRRGLTNMLARAREIGAELSVESPGESTTIRIVLPL